MGICGSPLARLKKIFFSHRLGTSVPNCDLVFFLVWASHDFFQFFPPPHQTENPRTDTGQEMWGFHIRCPHFIDFLLCLKQKVIVLRTFAKPGCYFHPPLCVLGTSQSSSIPLLQKWTTMKRNTNSEFQWKNDRVFAPGTVPEQSMKNMFTGPTNTAKLKLKTPKSW